MHSILTVEDQHHFKQLFTIQSSHGNSAYKDALQQQFLGLATSIFLSCDDDHVYRDRALQQLEMTMRLVAHCIKR